MALSLQKSACVQARAGARPVQALRPLTVRRSVVRAAASKKNDEQLAAEFGKMATLSAVASSWMFSGHAQAATELANLAASDNRLGTISLLFLPVIGWVGFNILQPALNQLNRQNEIKEEAVAATGRSSGRKKRGVAGAVGLGAALSLFAAQNADAATELSQLAASDNRLSTISLLFLPALAWVGFNMLQPATNQLNRMNALKEAAAGSSAGRKKRGVAGAVGLGAALSLFAAQNADAATELSQLAASDNRLSTISLLFLPALAWVGFNMLQPATNQLNRMNELKEAAAGSSAGRKKRGVAGAVGLGAALSLFAAQNADAATELSQLAASDNRLGTISLLFLPVIGWVGFNILQPALNQLNRQNEIKEEAVAATGRSSGRKKRGVAGAVGLGAALSLFAAQNADAATELSQLAASDNRFGTIALLFLPVLGWVGFNILQPALNQLNRQNEIKEEAAGTTRKASKPKRK